MNIYLLIIMMTAVTYIPRLLPFKFISHESLPVKLRQFLSFVPYAALGALVIPGGLNAIEGNPGLSAAGLAFAAVLAFFRVNVIISMALTILFIYPFLG